MSEMDKRQKAETLKQILQAYIGGMQALDEGRWADAVSDLDLPTVENHESAQLQLQEVYRDAQIQMQEAYYQWGSELERQGKLDEAIERLEAAGDHAQAVGKLKKAQAAQALKQELKVLYDQGQKALKEKRYDDAINLFLQVEEKAPHFQAIKVRRSLKKARRGYEKVKLENRLEEQYQSLLNEWNSQNFDQVVPLGDQILAQVPWSWWFFIRRYRDVFNKRRQAKQRLPVPPKKLKLYLVFFMFILIASTAVTTHLMWKVNNEVLNLLAGIVIPILGSIVGIVGFYLPQNEVNRQKFRDWQRRLVWVAGPLIGMLMGILIVAVKSTLVEAEILPQTTPTATSAPIAPTDTPTSVRIVTVTPTVSPVPPKETLSSTPYPPPVLVSPEDGSLFDEEQRIKLVWEWERDLAANEFFEVRIRLEGQPKFDSLAQIQSQYYFVLASDLAQSGIYEWQVAIVLLSGAERGVSPTWSFEVR